MDRARKLKTKEVEKMEVLPWSLLAKSIFRSPKSPYLVTKFEGQEYYS